MNAGLPGSGIGGLFYLAAALLMPVHRLLFGGGHEGRSWRQVLKQTLIACGVLLMLYVTAWALGFVPAAISYFAGSSNTGTTTGARAEYLEVPAVLRWLSALVSAGVLVIVLIAVEVAGLLLRRRTGRDRFRG